MIILFLNVTKTVDKKKKKEEEGAKLDVQLPIHLDFPFICGDSKRNLTVLLLQGMSQLISITIIHKHFVCLYLLHE